MLNNLKRNRSVFLTKYKIINNIFVSMEHAIKSNLNGNYYFRTFHIYLKEFVTSVLLGKLICKRFFFIKIYRFFSRIMNFVLKWFKFLFLFLFSVISATKYNAKEQIPLSPRQNIQANMFAFLHSSRKSDNLRRIFFNVYNTFLLLFHLCSMMNADKSMNEKV